MPKVNITRSGLTYDRYIAFLLAEKITTQFKELDFYLDQFNVFRNIINLLPCAVYILDYTTMRYLYMSEYVKVLFGYTAKEMIELGPASQLSRVHPDDLLVFKSTLFNEFINYSKSIPTEDLKDTVFALNIRSQRKDGTYVNFLPCFQMGVGYDTFTV